MEIKLPPEVAARCEALHSPRAAASPPAPKPGKPSKYRNTKVKTEDGTFDSKKEFERWCYLKQLAKAGAIQGLRRGKAAVFRLRSHTGKVVCSYWPDFRYVAGGRLVLEDVKSPLTRMNRVYRIKKKWLEADFGIRITEV